MADLSTAAIVRVGAGRGFVVNRPQQDRLVITAAHCLPTMPSPMTISHASERTYPKLLGSLRSKARTWAECLFVDPVADVAILGAPDGQAHFTEADEYERFVDAIDPALEIDTMADRAEIDAWVLSLNGKWCSCRATTHGAHGAIWLSQVRIAGGMSGSPIVNGSGNAIGVVATDAGAPQPRLASALPAWMFQRGGAR